MTADRYDATTDPTVLDALATAEPAAPKDRLYVLPTADAEGQNPPSADYIASHAVEVRGATDLRLADDERPMTQLQRLGILSAADRAVLRRLSGELTMAEWMAQPEDQRKAHPWRPDKRLRLVMAARVRGVENAQLMARLCPAMFVSPVRDA